MIRRLGLRVWPAFGVRFLFLGITGVARTQEAYTPYFARKKYTVKRRDLRLFLMFS